MTRQPELLEVPLGTAVLSAVAIGSAIVLACIVWRLLFGEVALGVPVTAAIVSIIVATPLILFLQHVIRRLAESKRTLTRLTAQLSAATTEAELASHAKSEFLARMSHELRTPLNAVIGYSEILLEDAEGDEQGQNVADLKRIHSAGRHLLSMVNDVLDLSNIEAGRMVIEAAPIDLHRFIDDIVATSRQSVRKNRNELEVKCGADLGTIIGDAAKLRQITLNLLSNAAKFTEGGLVTLEVTRETRPSGDWVSISVSDTGIGISPTSLARLFTSFTHAEPAIANKYGGTGLGLALSHRLCRLMGAEIIAESEPGSGSRFTIHVPATIAAG